MLIAVTKYGEFFYKYSYFCSTSTLFRIVAFHYGDSRLRSVDTEVGYPWTRDQPDADTLPDDIQHPKVSINTLYFIYSIS